MNTSLNQDSLKQLFTEARTFNGFTEQPVADATLHTLYDLMKWGPTSMNAQPARYLFLRSPEGRARLLPALAPTNQEKTRNAPMTVIVAFDPRFFNHLPSQFPAYDVKPMFTSNPLLAEATAFRNGSLQGAYLILAARSLGLDCGPMSGFDAEAVDAEFFADGDWKANFIVNIGYGDPQSIYPRGPRLSFNQVAKII